MLLLVVVALSLVLLWVVYYYYYSRGFSCHFSSDSVFPSGLWYLWGFLFLLKSILGIDLFIHSSITYFLEMDHPGNPFFGEEDSVGCFFGDVESEYSIYGSDSSINMEVEGLDVEVDADLYDEDGLSGRRTSGYRLRLPFGPTPQLDSVLVPLYSSGGGAGIFDRETMAYFQRDGSYGNDSPYGLCCAYQKISGDIHSSCGCILPLFQRHRHASCALHSPVDFRTILGLRYTMCLRAFAAARRSALTVDELNYFGFYTWHRIYAGRLPYVYWDRVPDFLLRCSYTGFLYPADCLMYVSRIRDRGMMKHRFEYDATLFKFISHCEFVHFGSFGVALGDEDTWNLDFPEVREEPFPDLELPMPPLGDQELGEFSKHAFMFTCA